MPDISSLDLSDTAFCSPLAHIVLVHIKEFSMRDEIKKENEQPRSCNRVLTLSSTAQVICDLAFLNDYS
jgi:hypothetical protein